jgi:hypothetical protein
MNNLDDRISAALHAAVDGLQQQDLRPADPLSRVARRRRPTRLVAPMLAAAAVVAAAAVTVAITRTPSTSHESAPGGSPAPSVTDPVSLPSPPAFGGEAPLWPFATLAEADQWKNVEAPEGHAPWHADAKATALSFVNNYLHFDDITKVTSADIGSSQADIGVGYDLPSGDEHTASVIHLMRFGGGDGPWEVVNAAADGFFINELVVKSQTGTPTRVGGHITGVDENVSAAIRTLDGVVDQGGPVPAGGDDAPWSVDVPSSVHGIATIVAWTGGHLTAHERFVVSPLTTR